MLSLLFLSFFLEYFIGEKTRDSMRCAQTVLQSAKRGWMLSKWPGDIKLNFCQAQPKLQVKLSLKAELALFSFDPATHPHPVKVYLAAQFQPILTVVDI